MPPPSPLADLGPAHALLVTGTDAAAFLHAQLASDVASLALGSWQWSAWLDARGRVRWLCQVGRCETQRMLVVLRGGDATAAAAALQRYVFRLQVQLDVITPCYRAAGDALPMHTLVTLADGGFALGLGDRSLIVGPQVASTHVAQADNFALADIRAGYPTLPDAALDTLLPPALSLYHLRAVAIDKGCYPGQEIVARLHHRGGHKQRLCRVSLDAILRPGETIRITEKSAGMVLATVGNQALCVLIDDADDVAGVLHVVETFPP